MNEDKKHRHDGTTQNLNFHFGSVTVNGPMFDIHDNENVYINGERMGKREPAPHGRKDEFLFSGKDGNKDEALTREKAHEFVAYLKENDLEGIAVNTSKKNEVNQTLAYFYKLWIHEGFVPRVPNSAACMRFLKEECGVSISVQESSYETFLRNYISESLSRK